MQYRFIMFINNMEKKEEKILTLQEASDISPYSVDYLSLLVRKEKLEGIKKDGKWYISKKSLNAYVNRLAEASYHRQETLNVKIPAIENKKVLVNLKWALALAVVAILGLVTWTFREKTNEEYKIEKDSNNNLIIHVEDPDSIGSVTVVPK
jgi:hypothetical protein